MAERPDNTKNQGGVRLELRQPLSSWEEGFRNITDGVMEKIQFTMTAIYVSEPSEYMDDRYVGRSPTLLEVEAVVVADIAGLWMEFYKVTESNVGYKKIPILPGSKPFVMLVVADTLRTVNEPVVDQEDGVTYCNSSFPGLYVVKKQNIEEDGVVESYYLRGAEGIPKQVLNDLETKNALQSAE